MPVLILMQGRKGDWPELICPCSWGFLGSCEALAEASPGPYPCPSQAAAVGWVDR